MITSFLQIFAEQINFLFIGNLNDTKMLAAVGLGNMCINIMAFSFIFGLNSALETFVSQSYGFKNMIQCGKYLNRGRAVLLIFFLPISMVLLYSSKILIFLGQDMEVSYLTGAYIFHLIPGILFMALFDANRTFLNAMNYTIVPTACYCLAVPLHILSAYLLVEILKYEVMGICYALNITYFSLFIFLHVYTSKIDSIKEAWFYPKLDDIFNQTDLYEYLKLGLPGALMMMINYLGCQLMALFAGYIGLNEQAAMVLFRINKKILLINFTTLIFMFPYGISLAACVLVGNSVGRNDQNEIKFVSKHLFLSSQFVVFLVIICSFYNKRSLAQLYTKEINTVELFDQNLIYLLISFYFDGTQNLFCGIIKGIGLQGPASIANLANGIFVQIPFGLLYAFIFDYGISGLWFGLGLGLLSNCCCYIYIILQADIDQIFQNAQQRITEKQVTLL